MPHFSNHSEENYLKTLYNLSVRNVKKVNNVTLSKALDLNPASVLEMVRKLVSKKLVEVQNDKSISLTGKGENTALLIIRKHRLWEVFLVQKLKYKWSEVHELAEQLEHIQSKDLIDRLDEFLNYPGFDPHGDPIPDRNGKIKQRTTHPLSNCEKGKKYKVHNLGETNDSFLDYLDKLNIQPGKTLKIVEKHSYDNTYSVMVQKKIVQLSEKVADNIFVHEL